MDEIEKYYQSLIELRDREALETSGVCLRIVSTLIACSGAIVVLSIELGVGDRCTPYSWVLHLSTLQHVLCILASLTAIGILLRRRIRRLRTIEDKVGQAKELWSLSKTIHVPHSHVEFVLLGVCVVASFALFASAITTLVLYSMLP